MREEEIQKKLNGARELQTAMARFPEDGVQENSDLNEYIAALSGIKAGETNLMDGHIGGNQEMIEKTINVLTFLRDKYGAKTYGEAIQLLKNRTVDSKIIKFWIEEGMIGDYDYFEAIYEGYPELRPLIEIKKKQAGRAKESAQKYNSQYIVPRGRIIEPEEAETIEDLLFIAPDYRPGGLRLLIERARQRGISISDSEMRKIMLKCIYGTFRFPNSYYTFELRKQDVDESGINFSSQERAKLLNKEEIN